MHFIGLTEDESVAIDAFYVNRALSSESIFSREFAFSIKHRLLEGSCQNNILSSIYLCRVFFLLFLLSLHGYPPGEFAILASEPLDTVTIYFSISPQMKMWQ